MNVQFFLYSFQRHLYILAVIHMFIRINVILAHFECLSVCHLFRQTNLAWFIMHLKRRFHPICINLILSWLNRATFLLIHKCPYRIGIGHSLTRLIHHLEITLCQNSFKTGGPCAHLYPFSDLWVTLDYDLPVRQYPCLSFCLKTFYSITDVF